MVDLEKHHGVGDSMRWRLYFMVDKKNKANLRIKINQFNSLGLMSKGETSRIFSVNTVKVHWKMSTSIHD